VNNTGTKYVIITKQTAFWREKNGEYITCLKYSVLIFVEQIYKMQRLEVSGAVRPLYGSLGVKRVIFMGVLLHSSSKYKYSCRSNVRLNAFVQFEVLTFVKPHIVIFWVMTICGFVGGVHCFGIKFCFHFQAWETCQAILHAVVI